MNAYKNSYNKKFENLFLKIYSNIHLERIQLIHQKILIIICIFILPVFCQSQDTIIISPKVGKIIDSAEKVKFSIMPYFSRQKFISAVFIKNVDSTIQLLARLKPDSISVKNFSQVEFEWTRNLINGVKLNSESIYQNTEYNLTTTNRNDLFLILGIGKSPIGLAGSVSLSLRIKSKLFSLHYIGSGELNLFEFFGSKYPAKSVSEIGFLCGLTPESKDKKHNVSILIGMGYITGVKRGKFLYSTSSLFGDRYYENISYSKLGLPIEFQFMTKTHSGIGFSIYGNLLESDLSGALLCIYF